jgi:beta-galactosidase/beta-glucuronidase
MVRPNWMNLNGVWEFEIDGGRSGRERQLPAAERLQGQITVPFCPESSLSGVGHTDFMPAVWYRRTVTLPAAYTGQRMLLHFGAVDYDCEVWVNGRSAGTHRGGYASFTLEITACVREGENSITVCAEDDLRGRLQPGGKQSSQFHSYGCSYTRTTGIWQTVWLEAVPQQYLGRPKITPNLANGLADIEVPLHGVPDGLTLQLEALLDGHVVGTAHVQPDGHLFRAALKLDDVRPWAPGSPTLYDLRLTLSGADGPVDGAESYFGLRSITLAPPAILLNGKPVFQRLILDQGFYPDGIYTAPSDAELRADIERAQAMGFNGARLHQKVFEERFLYWADRLGYLVWGEMADWGLHLADPRALDRFLTEWRQVLARDYSHPAIVGWCPFNETWDGVFPDLLGQIYHVTKQMDPTRPAIDTSGNYHVGPTDVYDAHDYEQDPAVFAARHVAFAAGGSPHEYFNGKDAPYAGQPYFISEYGGIWWNPGQSEEKSWGYGDRPRTDEEFIARYRGLTEALLQHPRMCGFCYTQLTDVEQEVNGLYTYERKPKFDPAIIRAITAQPAAIEQAALPGSRDDR